jgi:hypothetical protein
MAPVWWQQGHHSKVIDYCLNDVWLEAKLCLYMRNGGLVKAAGKEPLQFEKPRPTVAELEEILKQESTAQNRILAIAHILRALLEKSGIEAELAFTLVMAELAERE